MTTENLKAVLTEEELGFISEFTAIGGVFTKIIYRLADEVVRLREEVGLLREEWNGGEWEGHEPFDDYYTDALLEISKYKSKTSLVSWYAHMKREKDKCIQELEAQVTALKKLDDDNNADSVRRLKHMEEDKRRIKELENALHEVKEREVREIERTIVAEAKLKAWEDAEVLEIRAGTYHLKPTEAEDAQGN